MSLLNEIRHNYYPAWPVVQQGKKYALPATKATKTPQRDYSVAVILPDMQLGYFRTHDNALEPIHDEQALDVALQIVKASKPDQIVLVGDNLDLCEFGKYRYTPAFARTTQAAIDRASQLCAQLRKLAPDARIVWIAGNHEERLGNFILDGAGAAFGLRRGLRPEEWPVMSVPYLCNLDDYGWSICLDTRRVRIGSTSVFMSFMVTRLPPVEVPPTSILRQSKPQSSTVTFTDENGLNGLGMTMMEREQSSLHRLVV